MVFFICDACGESVKRGMVQKHVAKCRSCWVLSCVDCLKTFEGDAYLTHMACMSEAQRYQGALYRPKENKAERLQNAWMVCVRAALVAMGKDGAGAPPGALRALRSLAMNDNVPRKKKKFINFVKNSQPRCEYIELMWTFIETEQTAAKAAEVAAVAAAKAAAEKANPGSTKRKAEAAAAASASKKAKLAAEDSDSSGWSDSDDDAEKAELVKKAIMAAAEKAAEKAAAEAKAARKAKKKAKKAKRAGTAAAAAAAVASAASSAVKKVKKSKKEKKKKQKKKKQDAATERLAAGL